MVGLGSSLGNHPGLAAWDGAATRLDRALAPLLPPYGWNVGELRLSSLLPL